MTNVDQLFNRLEIGTGKFAFDQNVAEVFDNMITRSVPLYAESQELIPRLIQLMLGKSQDKSKEVCIVDLGCSTGTSLLKLADRFPAEHYPQLKLIGVDNSAAMLDECQKKIDEAGKDPRIEIVCDDIRNVQFESVSLVVVNYTLQFVPVEERLDLLKKIRGFLRSGGKLLLSEKFCHNDPEFDRLIFELYFEYKRKNGYSDLEIARKRDALENVLIPYTVDENRRILVEAGFVEPEVILKWFNFGTFLAHAN